jgi:hypothetical protein
MSQPKSSLAQLNLPLLEAAPLALPPGKDRQLIQALIELLLGGARVTPSAASAEGGSHESQTDR